MRDGGELKSSNVVLVLGMHRSGTSAIAACLERLGVVMGSSLAQADEWNPKGYFEEREIVIFNDHLLSAAGCRWDSPLPPPPAQRDEWNQQAAPAVALLENIFGQAPTWGFKDPRMCLLSSFWQPVLASMHVSPRLLFVLRDPAEVAHSLARRDGISPKRAGWLWFTHLLGSLDYIHADADCRLVDFADLMSRPGQVMTGLCTWLGLDCKPDAIAQFSSDFISPQLSHGADAASAGIPPLVLRAYAYWRKVAENAGMSQAALHAAEWVEIREEFERDVKPDLAVVQAFFDGDRQWAMADGRSKALSEGLAAAEGLAVARLEQLSALNSQLEQTSAALVSVEQLAVERLEQLSAMDSQLAQTSTALGSVEKLAVERLGEVEKLDQQVKQVTAAFEVAEKLAIERMSELEKFRTRS